jgi:tetratricopeptide (TPR) repeat protein
MCVRELLRAIKKLKTRLSERGVYFALARVYGTLGDIYREILSLERVAIACFHKEVRLLNELGRQRERVSAQIDLGAVLEAYGRYSDALTVNREALETAKGNSFSEFIGTILYNRGNYYAAVELYSLAQASYRDAEKYAPESDQVNILQMIQHNLGEVIRRQGRPDTAIELLKGVLSRERELNHPFGIVLALNNIGLAYEETEQQSEALSCWDEAVSISRLHSLKREEANSLISIGNFYLMRDQPEKAKRNYEEAWSAARAAGDTEMEESCVLSLAEAHRQLGTFESFQEEFKKALERADELAHYENLVKFLTIAGQINLDEEESELSAEMFEQAVLLAFWRTLQTAQQFDNAPDRPLLGSEIADVIGRITTAIENCMDRDKPEVARNMAQSLIDRLKARGYFDNASFPLNYLTYAIEYVDLRPTERIHRYIVKRLDAEESQQVAQA